MGGEENGNGKGIQPIDCSITEIIVVRHGETDWNILRKVQGQLDIDLNETGRQQAVAVADHLSKELNISAIYSSDLRRALETAETIATRFGGGLEVIKDQDLRERHLGVLQGLPFDDFCNVNPKAHEAFMTSDQEIEGGGESRNQLFKRCTSLLQRIGDKHKGERVIIVSHGAVIESLWKRALPKIQGGHIMNASIGIIELSQGEKWSIKSWNDVSHLKKIGFLKSAFGGEASSA